MHQLLQCPWDYTLYDNSGILLLSVLCGGVGMYERNINLSLHETEQYKAIGESYIIQLAQEIREDQRKYEFRFI
jgi:hypothetical protein